MNDSWSYKNRKICQVNTVNMWFILVDAFVALGGNPDGSGSVRKEKMLDILS